MRRLPVILLLIACAFVPARGWAQVLVNGADVHVATGGEVIVVTDSLFVDQEGLLDQNGLLIIDRDLINRQGRVDNTGTIDVNRHVVNGDTLRGFGPATRFLVFGDWTNDGFFDAGQSRTVLDGTVQTIDGSRISNFHDLEAEGTLADVKRLDGIDAWVLNVLDLGDVEFATDVHTLRVNDTDLNAIVRVDGFVSSLGDGRLERRTARVDDYLFPTGSTDGVLRYRPLVLRPNGADTTVFGARLANVNPGDEGYDIVFLGDSLCAVNPNFYHRIYGDAAADITMFYRPAEDGEWDAMAQWQPDDEWDKLPGEVTGVDPSFSTLTIPAWDDFGEPAFALGIARPVLDAGPDETMDVGGEVQLDANYVGPTPDDVLWGPISEVSCFDCLDPVVSPDTTTLFRLQVTVTEQCVLRDSVLVLIDFGDLAFPTGFTPNGDGTNDVFRPMNDRLDLFELSVWNRWGEKVYETTDPTRGWDGTYAGQTSPLGVYTFSARYRYPNDDEARTATGNVTLIR